MNMSPLEKIHFNEFPFAFISAKILIVGDLIMLLHPMLYVKYLIMRKAQMRAGAIRKLLYGWKIITRTYPYRRTNHTITSARNIVH